MNKQKNKRMSMRNKTDSYTENQEDMHVQNMTRKSIDSYLSGRSVSAMACSSSDLVSLRRPFSLQKKELLVSEGSSRAIFRPQTFAKIARKNSSPHLGDLGADTKLPA